jgi:acyl dehydratase
MAVNADAVGRSYGPGEPYEVTRVKIREFADAVGATSDTHRSVEAAAAAGFADVVAPTTFAVVIAQRAEVPAIMDPEVGVDFSKVVHAGISMVTTRAELADAAGVPVATVVSTLAVREDA